MFACRIWGLRSTDLNQGIVYGQETDETVLHPDLATRFDYDGVFGTVLNRFCVQAVAGHPLTVYGAGGQTRGMLDIRDTLACVELALNNPAARGRVPGVQPVHRVVLGPRSWPRWWPRRSAGHGRDRLGTPNPRVEKEEHYYRAAHTKLLDLGLVPHLLDRSTIASILAVAERNRDRIDPVAITPTVNWRHTAADTPVADGQKTGSPRS